MAKTWTVTEFSISVLSEQNGTVIAWWKFNTGGTTDRFDVWWYYWSESQGWWVIAGNSTTQVNSGTNGWFQNVFTAPNDPDATKLKCWVKAIPQTNDKGRYKWSSAGKYSNVLTSPRVTAEQKARLEPPDTPTGSGVISSGRVVLSISNQATYANRTFVYRSVNGGPYNLAARVSKSATSWTDRDVSAGNVYRYRLKAALRNGTLSRAYSAVIGPFSMKPTAPTGLTATALTSTSVKLEWTNTGRTGSWYEVQWSDDGSAWSNNLDSINTSGRQDSTGHVYTVTGLESGKRWYFRVKRGNDVGSVWAIVSGNQVTASVILGTVPSAPTAYTSVATAQTGAKVVLRWVHNSEDGSAQSAYEVTVQVIDDGSVVETKSISGSDQTSTVELDLATLAYAQDGTTVRWSVRTKGAMPDWSPESAAQDISLWSPPTVSIFLGDNLGEELETDDNGYVMTHYPLSVLVMTNLPSSSDQRVVRWWSYLTSNDSYETVGPDGSDVWVAAGQQLWRSDYISDSIWAFDVPLMNGASYTVGGGCVTSAGITVEAEPVNVTVWIHTEELPQPFAEFDFDEDNLSMVIRPWCYEYSDEQSPDDESGGTLVQDVSLSVYRINADGTTTLIEDNIKNDGQQWVIDPHPRFGTCGYRVMVSDSYTGSQTATDGFAEAPYDKMVIQWDEDWLSVSDNGAEGEQVTGNRVEIESNLSVSEGYKPSVTLREYDGREHPVAYYGTQLGQTAKWSGVIVDYYDSDKLEALRSLARYHGDCYVREPSGTGFWANVGNLSIGHESRSAAISVSFDVTRIEHEGA